MGDHYRPDERWSGDFPLQATLLLSSRTSRQQRQDPRIALVAQGIERLPPEQKVVGSNPIEGTITTSTPVH